MVKKIFSAIKRRWNFYKTYKFMKRYNIMNSIDSICYILTNRCSVSRFGDGEFGIIWGIGNGFQKADKKLADRLKEVITIPIPNHEVAVPIHIKDKTIHINPRLFWIPFTTEHAEDLRKLLSTNRIYLDTQLTRFYMERKDKSQCKKHIELLKQLWNNRDIIIVEGSQTRSGIGNDLYNNAKSIKRIIGLSTNAFNKYNEMLQAITTHARKEQLILLSYGMTATVLAYDLCKSGYWAIDIGHLDIEYEWYKSNAKSKTTVKGKFTNETEQSGGHIVTECNDSEYLSQIICDINQINK